MNTLPHIHLCIMQPTGYVHSLGFLDQARYFRHQFRRMGAQVSLAKNRLRHDAVNSVNVVRSLTLDPRRCAVERWDYEPHAQAFAPVDRVEMELDAHAAVTH